MTSLTVWVLPRLAERQPDLHVVLEILDVVDDASSDVKHLCRHRLDVWIQRVGEQR